MGRHMDRRRFLAGIGLLTVGGAAGAGLTAEPGLATEAPTARTAAPSGPGSYTATVLFRASPSARLVALTIDDGPTSEWTPQVLAILRRHGAKATFFRVGQRAQAAPDLVRQTADAGHEQGNHTGARRPDPARRGICSRKPGTHPSAAGGTDRPGADAVQAALWPYR